MSRVTKALEMVVGAYELGQYDSNVIGMAAEVIAEEEFGMKKAPRGMKDVDGTWFRDGRDHTVQVKAWSEDRVKTYRQFTYFRLRENALPDVLLCILVYCSKPGYEIIYNGSPRDVGYVEKNGRDRVIRFSHMRTPEEVASILRGLGVEEKVVRPRRPNASRDPKAPVVESDSRKPCSICGVSFPVEEFHYGGRTTNSYCTSCCKLHRQAYNRGGSEGTRLFREEMRKNWKN
jgi:hypothetical protein